MLLAALSGALLLAASGDAPLTERACGQHPGQASAAPAGGATPGITQRERGGALKSARRYAEALEAYCAALASDEESLGHVNASIAVDYAGIGEVLEYMDRSAEAEEWLRDALAITAKLAPEGAAEVPALVDLADLLAYTDRYAEALELYQRALAVNEGIHGPDDLAARTLNGLGRVLGNMGRYLEAEESLRRAYALNARVHGADDLSSAMILNSLAKVLESMGRHGEAEELFRRILALNERIRAPEDFTASVLNNLAHVLELTGRPAESEESFRRALAMSERVRGPNAVQTASELNNLAMLLGDTGRCQEAQPLLWRALDIEERKLGSEHPMVARALKNLAVSLERCGRAAAALPLLLRAYRIATFSGEPDLLWVVEDLLRQHYEPTAPPLAVFYGKQAVNTIQGLRQGLANATRETQTSYAAKVGAVFGGLADLLISQGRLPEAEQVLGMLKQEEYFEFIERDAVQDPREISAACNPVEQEWCERFVQIRNRVVAIGREYNDLARKSRLTPDEAKRYASLQADRTIANTEFDDYLAHLQADLAKTTSSGSVLEMAEAFLTNLGKNERDALTTMGQGAVIVHYLVTPERLRIVLTTRDIRVHREAEISEETLNQRIAAFVLALRSTAVDPRLSAEALYDVLIRPIERDLEQAEGHTLMISLQGALHYVPLSALYDGRRGEWLAERYAVALYTEAANVHLTEKPSTRWQAAALGMSQAAPDFRALPGVPAELDSVVHDAQRHSRGVLPGVERLDEDFTAAELTRLLEGGLSDDPRRRYQVLHIASHFDLAPANVQASFLLLGDTGHLSLAAFRSGPYPMDGVELLTLSACETAVGGSKIGGREVDGLAGVALQKGARGVLASLWSVADATTAVLMKRFYSLREQQHLSKAETLRQVQLDFISGRVGEAALTEVERGYPHQAAPVPPVRPWQDRPDAPYSHPHFWAPFILMGNWL